MDINNLISFGSLIVAIFAIVFSVVNSMKTNNINKRINNANIKQRYYQCVFEDYLINRLPEARGIIYFSPGGKLLETQLLVDALDDMMKHAKFFRYEDEVFYSELKKLTQSLGDFLMKKGNETTDADERSKVDDTIDNSMGKIYKCIEQNYIDLI